MKLEKTSETNKTVVFQSNCTQEEICQAIQQLTEESTKGSFFAFKNPFTSIYYAGARVRKDHISIPRSLTTPRMYMEFENIPTEVTFRVSYFPVLRWTFYVGAPIIVYSLYRSIKKETSTDIILFAVGLGLVICSFLALLAYIEKKWNNYFFKRDVNKIVKDLAPYFD